jgi:hypothetical protein
MAHTMKNTADWPRSAATIRTASPRSPRRKELLAATYTWMRIADTYGNLCIFFNGPTLD